ncbi:hypothetical protein PYW08_006603 [Mythimna loreyi]|uniref:Uncharacterized protein n=1 Tax=Mythimna loreyi TaxID=667449 RepID=A0ACC2QN23_9NEOP|nr:hypothetical protein PYW08_006603 [Mythimna loreyi]
MAGVQRTPPGPSNTQKYNTSQSTQSQTQPGPDTNTPIITSDYVNINRTKRARQGNSPQGATVEVEISSDVKNTQDDSITQTLLGQTKLMSKLLSEVSQIKTQNTQIQATNTEIRKSNEEIEKSMFYMNQNFEDLRKEVEDLRKERQEQQKYIESLEQKISDLQHRSRSSGVELRNVPQGNAENHTTLMKTVCSIGEAVGVQIPESELRDVYRLPGKSTTSDLPRPIIAEFTRVQTKQSLLSAVRLFNKDKDKDRKLNTTAIGFPGKHQPVYVAEQLPTITKKLFYQSREFAKRYNYTYCSVL